MATLVGAGRVTAGSGGVGRVEVGAVELRRIRFALRHPLRSAHGEEVTRDLVLVRVELDDGTSGWGECSALTRPTYTNEYTAGCWAILRDELAPALLAGREDDVVGHPMATAAVDGAHSDARLRRRDRSLVAELGLGHGRPVDAVAATAVIGRTDDIDELLATVAARVEEGAALVKLKVSPRPAELDAVAAVRATWPDLATAVDANGSLDRRSLAILDTMGLAYIEQPAPAADLVGSAGFASRLATPVALDESVTSTAAFRAADALGAGRIVNVKPARLGGVVEAAEVARTAADAGWGVFVGAMLESGVGRATALAVAALSWCTIPCDLGPSARYLDDDVTEPIVADGAGLVVVPTGPGIGVTPRPERLEALTTDQLLLRR